MAWTDRFIRDDAAGGGNGTTNVSGGANGAWTLAEGITNAAAGMRLNVRAGTYASTTTTRTLAAVGTTTAPIWWRGFNTAIGDLDDSHALALPALTFTTGQLVISGSYHILSSLDISGAQVTNGQVRTNTGSRNHIDRCRIECTSANANGRAVSASSVSTILTRSWLKCTSSAPVVTIGAAGCGMLGCSLEGGTNGVVVTTANQVIALCAFRDVGGDAIQVTSATAAVWALLNTFYSAGSDGIEFTVDPTTNNSVIAGNIFSESAGYGINSSIGTTTANLIRIANLFHSNTSGKENGVGDTPSLAEQVDSASPFTNAAGGDLSLVSTSNAKGNGPPGAFENQSYVGYTDVGAVQRQEAAAGGGGGVPLIGGGLVR